METVSAANLNIAPQPYADRSRASVSDPARRDVAAQFQVALQNDAARSARESAEGQKRAEQARAAKATENISQEARILFEYEQAHRVMKVQDSKGVLIYQVPPKGALQLIMQEEQQAKLEENA